MLDFLLQHRCLLQHTGRRFKPKQASSNKDIETKPKFKHQIKATGTHVPTSERTREKAVTADEIVETHSHIMSAENECKDRSSDDESDSSNSTEDDVTSLQCSQDDDDDSETKESYDTKQMPSSDVCRESLCKTVKQFDGRQIDRSDAHSKQCDKTKNRSSGASLSLNSEMVVTKLNLDTISTTEEKKDDISFLFKGKRHAKNGRHNNSV